MLAYDGNATLSYQPMIFIVFELRANGLVAASSEYNKQQGPKFNHGSKFNC